MSIQFTQSCPTCGRRAQIRAELIGSTVGCQHCHAEFVAAPGVPASSGSYRREQHAMERSSDPLMARVEKALARVEDPKAYS